MSRAFEELPYRRRADPAAVRHSVERLSRQDRWTLDEQLAEQLAEAERQLAKEAEVAKRYSDSDLNYCLSVQAAQARREAEIRAAELANQPPKPDPSEILEQAYWWRSNQGWVAVQEMRPVHALNAAAYLLRAVEAVNQDIDLVRETPMWKALMKRARKGPAS